MRRDSATGKPGLSLSKVTGGERETLTALGITRLGRPVFHDDTPQIRGMIKKIEHLLEVREVDEQG